jgi:hypothetical protein
MKQTLFLSDHHNQTKILSFVEDIRKLMKNIEDVERLEHAFHIFLGKLQQREFVFQDNLAKIKSKTDYLRSFTKNTISLNIPNEFYQDRQIRDDQTQAELPNKVHKNKKRHQTFDQNSTEVRFNNKDIEDLEDDLLYNLN